MSTLQDKRIKEAYHRIIFDTEFSDQPSLAFAEGFTSGYIEAINNVRQILNKIDADDHSYKDLEDVYDALCEITKE